jgi:hypothetical protein
VRPPLMKLPQAEIERIRMALVAAGLLLALGAAKNTRGERASCTP